MSRILPPLFELSTEKTDRARMLEEWRVGHRVVAETPHTCPCGKTGIKELCYIHHLVTGRSLAIGNCCVGVFPASALCGRCKLYPIVSGSSHLCRFCGRNRKDGPTGVVSVGTPRFGAPILGLTYAAAALANRSYADWLVNNPHKVIGRFPSHDPHLLAFLQMIERRVAAKARASGKRTTIISCDEK